MENFYETNIELFGHHSKSYIGLKHNTAHHQKNTILILNNRGSLCAVCFSWKRALKVLGRKDLQANTSQSKTFS